MFSHLPREQKKDYQEVVKVLQQHFGPKEKIFVYQAEMQARKSGPDEKLSDLSREIKEKTKLAHPEATGVTLDSLMTSCFLASLVDKAMRLFVATKHLRTMTEALALATEYESIMAADRTDGEPRKNIRAIKNAENEHPETVDKPDTELLMIL